MTNPQLIPTNFRVPNGCRHEWLLFHENQCIGAIYGVPGKRQLHQMIRQSPAPCNPALIQSRTLDWMAETVEHLRFLCGQ